MFHRFSMLVCRFALLFVYRFKCEGRENIPKEGGCVLALNHRSYIDVVLAGMTCPRKINYMAKSELFKNKLFGALIRAFGAFPVHRGTGDVGAIKSALAKLGAGDIVLIFPEGRCVRNPEEEKTTRAKPGAVMLAVSAGVPVVPAYISGRIGFMGKITLRYGKPVYFDEYKGKKLSVSELQTLSDGLMSGIRALKVEK